MSPGGAAAPPFRLVAESETCRQTSRIPDPSRLRSFDNPGFHFGQSTQLMRQVARGAASRAPGCCSRLLSTE
jgi:hypothetical protein